MTLQQQFKALGDDSRLRILALLSSGLYNVQEVTHILQLAQPTVSHHLKVLARNGFVRSLRDGNHMYYCLTEERERSIATTLLRAFLDALPLDDSELSQNIRQDRRHAQELAERRRSHTTDFFNAVARDWSAIRQEAVGQENFLDMVARSIGKNETVLEVGCGAGALLDLIAPRSGQTIGVDSSEAMLAEAKKKLGARAERVDLRLGYFEHLPVGDESIDSLVAYMVLHHAPNPQDALADGFRVLKKGGTCTLVDLVAHDKEYMRDRFADIWLGFTPQQVTEWLESFGFQRIETSILGEKEEIFIVTCTK